MDKCFCHLNGYAVKDATARKMIENLQVINTVSGGKLRFFVGTEEEYTLLDEALKENVFAIITDDKSKEEIESAISSLSEGMNSIGEEVNLITNSLNELGEKITELENEVEDNETSTSEDFTILSPTSSSEAGFSNNTYLYSGTAEFRMKYSLTTHFMLQIDFNYGSLNHSITLIITRDVLTGNSRSNVFSICDKNNNEVKMFITGVSTGGEPDCLAIYLIGTSSQITASSVKIKPI